MFPSGVFWNDYDFKNMCGFICVCVCLVGLCVYPHACTCACVYFGPNSHCVWSRYINAKLVSSGAKIKMPVKLGSVMLMITAEKGLLVTPY